MHHLATGMHTGIGAARADRAMRFSGEFTNRRLKTILNGVAVGLGLPAVPVGAVVLQPEGDSHG